MPNYILTVTVPAANIRAVEALLKKTFPKGGEVVAKAEKVRTPETRAERLDEARELVERAVEVVGELRDEMTEWRDNIPENMQGGEKFSAVDEAATELDNIASELDNIDFGAVEFPGMMG